MIFLTLPIFFDRPQLTLFFLSCTVYFFIFILIDVYLLNTQTLKSKIKNLFLIKKIRIYKNFYFLLFVSMHEHGCLDFHIQNKNLYKTEQKKS
jgi:hypothetical protein